MSTWLDKTVNGLDCLRTDSEAVGAAGRTKSLLADCILVRMSDGAVTVAEPTSLPTLSPAQAKMIKYFLAERGMAAPDIFAGQPAREAPETDATDEKEVAA